MKLLELHIAGFRNIENPQGVSISPHATGFWGPNGQGKSNLLEAIFIALKGWSFRPFSQKVDWFTKSVNNSEKRPPLFVGLRLEDLAGSRLQIDLRENVDKPGQLVWFFNEKRMSASQISDRMPVVVFSPEDHSLIRGAPEERRSYMDMVFGDVTPGYTEILDRFAKALKSRNRVLKEMQKREQKTSPELGTWTEVLALEAHLLSQIRHEIWPSFRAKFLKVGETLFEGQLKFIDIVGQWDSCEGEAPLQKDQYIQVLRDNFAVDLATGWTHRGPQRDDFSIQLEGLEAKTHASQGQARLFALSLKWAHALWVEDARREKPLFLIDDFSNELDILRRKKLLEMLGQISGQVLITGTDPNSIEAGLFGDFKSYRVERGEVKNF